MGYERRAHVRTDVHVTTLEGVPLARGVVESHNAEEALIAITAPLRKRDILRFRLILHWYPPSQVERFGEVLWVRYAFNPDEHLAVECRVRWVAASECDETATPETSVA